MTPILRTPTHSDPPHNSYFLTEAQDLLKIIEQGVLSLRSNRTSANVHELMRAAHTLKGAAASVGLSAINNVAHVLEDIFRAFYNPAVEIDTEIEGLLFEGYECLRLLLTAQLDGSQVDESDTLNRAADVIARLQEKLGDRFDRDTPIPSSAELGFDMVQSMFEIGVTQRLEELSQAVVRHAPDLDEVLRSQAEIFLGLAESLELPGFAAIAQTTLAALERHPEATHPIAQIALQDFTQGRAQVLAGDRSQGGAPSPQLQQFAHSRSVEPASIGHSGRDASTAPEMLNGRISQQPNNQIPESTQSALSPTLASARAFSAQINSPLASLINLLQTEIPLEAWLQRLKTKITSSKTLSRRFRPLFLRPTFLPASRNTPVVSPFAENLSSDLPPTLPLEALLSNLDSPSASVANGFAIADSNAAESDSPSEAWNVSFAANSLENFEESRSPWCIETPAPNDTSENIDSFNPEFNSDRAFDVAIELNDVAQSIAESSSTSFPNSSIELNRSQSPSILEKESSQRSYPSPTAVSFKSSSANPAASTLSTPNASVRVDLEKLEKLNYLIGELLINQNQQTSQDDTLRLMVQELLDRLQKQQRTIDQLCSQSDRFLLSRQPHNCKNTEHASSIVQQFDELEMDRYSEIHILSRSTLDKVMELKSISEALDQTIRQSRRSLEAQQRLLFVVGNDLTALRMQPLDALFARLTQVIQQLSTSHHKPVEVIVTGTQVLVDKTIVEKLYDPLLHLVRNAFDHGIEPAETRQAMGKPAVGRIEINAYHQGHRTIIEVKDDGPGINLQRVAQRAVEMGWLPEKAIATTSENTLLSYLFEPGFSTATQVSSLSGRGVGLDVVRSQIGGFKGSVAVSSVSQQGTTFSLQIPLSLTIAKLLLCKNQGISYALPIDAIEQIVSKPDALSQVGRQQVLQWRKGDEEQAVVVRPLSALVSDLVNDSEIPHTLAAAQPPIPTPLSIVLVRTDAGLMGIQVEQVLGEQELVIRPFGQAIAPPPYIYGCCIVGNNQLALVIDIRTLFQQVTSLQQATGSQQATESARTSVHQPGIVPTRSPADAAFAASPSPQTLDQALPTSASLTASTPVAPASKRSPRHFHILLIEDSLTLRQTLSQLLQQEGYQVSQAKDGLEGLAFLQKHPGIDLVLCDIEMPRMNGFEFLSQRHQHRSLAKIPVVMLTSRSSAKYRQFAIDLGATDFITKPYVDQNLLSTIHHFLVHDKV
ncbi:hybrid sensor histidine kinase/response regulator [Leptolyngbya sp. FACHB-711]|uniref:hybrid sensor histidine kinase/response regulator n=1 Tax=unclassified Leptolyngbya TaxID=2650499 RepID=UPI00168615C4|nr:hybrid sensor histidine kinase/response regulator [Leptolyngbya sp. FACHB-711]MBD1849035.1 response regulator [Cyanobacteria bacterium FACHB-502]MBD2027890.1 response regulator [Leptolyngbya sp. FACHB-711]